MPLQRTPLEQEGPEEAHLALLMDESGMRLAIPPGASLWVVEDKRDMTKVFPLTLRKVSHKALTFVMVDEKGAAVEYVYKLQQAKPLNRAALLRLKEQANPNAKIQR